MLYYVTGNKNKIEVAKKFLNPLGIEFTPKTLDLIEIQSHDIQDIALRKSKHAFEVLNEPLFANDHGWSIPALNGFPGAYMKYINGWFTAKDLLKLMEGKKSREAILTEVISYVDMNQIKTFTMKHHGVVLDESQGEGPPGLTTISLTGDGISIAKKLEKSPSAVEDYKIWNDFAQWYKNRRIST